MSGAPLPNPGGGWVGTLASDGGRAAASTGFGCLAAFPVLACVVACVVGCVACVACVNVRAVGAARPSFCDSAAAWGPCTNATARAALPTSLRHMIDCNR